MSCSRPAMYVVSPSESANFSLNFRQTIAHPSECLQKTTGSNTHFFTGNACPMQHVGRIDSRRRCAPFGQRAEHDHWSLGIGLTDLGQHLQPVHHRHFDVQRDQVGMQLRHFCQNRWVNQVERPCIARMNWLQCNVSASWLRFLGADRPPGGSMRGKRMRTVVEEIVRLVFS